MIEKVTHRSLGADELSSNAMGGTEMQKYALFHKLDPELRDKFQFICSRVRDIDPELIPILWLHDLWQDPEAMRLKDPAFRKPFGKMVFVSEWQRDSYVKNLGIPKADTHVIRNAIEPFTLDSMWHKPTPNPIRLIYHTTPHRGLELLIPVFEYIWERCSQNIILDVYSSFNIYGWPQRDAQYEELFERCRQHPGIIYHGYQPNDVIRAALKKTHIFAYPSIWQETSCIAMIEAMSAGCYCIAPNYGALQETMGGYGLCYEWFKDMDSHAITFTAALIHTIRKIESGELSWPDEAFEAQYHRFHLDYNWSHRIDQWESFLEHRAAAARA